MHVENIDSDNSQNEYYLTDVVEKLVEAGDGVTSLKLKDFIQVMGVNDRNQLAEVEKILKQKINQKFMEQGVSIKDPENTYIQDTVEIEKDTTIEPYCFITGITTIGAGCRIGPFCQS
ncbi:MAG: hypothetical protein U5N58_14060 [Actinomycetota bacterium]|nr:hypothetical protein [Actinomycetota bacterium]